MLAIARILILWLIATGSIYVWDYYWKLKKRPEIEKKWVRYLTVHNGRYIANDIKYNKTVIIIPDKKNVYSITKAALILQISCHIYALLAIGLDIVYETTKNEIVSLVAILMRLIYLIIAFTLLFAGPVKVQKAEKILWNEKFEKLTKRGARNTVTIVQMKSLLNDGKEFHFEVYGLPLVLRSYKEEKWKEAKWQLFDENCQRGYRVDNSIDDILNKTAINGKTIKELWPFINSR